MLEYRPKQYQIRHRPDRYSYQHSPNQFGHFRVTARRRLAQYRRSAVGGTEVCFTSGAVVRFGARGTIHKVRALSAVHSGRAGTKRLICCSAWYKSRKKAQCTKQKDTGNRVVCISVPKTAQEVRRPARYRARRTLQHRPISVLDSAGVQYSITYLSTGQRVAGA
eukprot:3886937-Rhodomonas_salina.1